MKAWDPDMFNYLKKSQWNELVIDCSQLLGIGGEAMIIRRPKNLALDQPAKKTKSNVALKIIPMTNFITGNQNLNEIKWAAHNMEFVNDFQSAYSNPLRYEHDSLIKYSNIRLDFITVFEEKCFVIVIGKFRILCILYRLFIKEMPVYDMSLRDFLKITSMQKNFPLAERIEMTQRICDGLLYLNNKSKTHRDIKLRMVSKLLFLS